MAEEGEHSDIATASEKRLQTAQDRRKIPGGFGSEDLDDLSPNKADFGDSYFANISNHSQNNRVPSFNPASLPSLPPPTESSFIYSRSGNGDDHSERHMDELDEKAMHRHLNDVESSFLHAVSPIGMMGRKGADDTYLFDGAQESRMGELSPVMEAVAAVPYQVSGRNSPPTPPNAYRTPAPERADLVSEENTMNAGDTTASLETLSSSPTAAAAARTVSRAISAASTGGYQTANDDGEGVEEFTDEEGDLEATPRKSKDVDDQSTLRHHLSNRSLNNAFSLDAGSTPGISLLKRHSSGKRPKFLRSRHGSQRSSISSFITNPESHDGSDVTLGADYALQSGGAVPAGGFSRNTSIALSRSISLGSMASGIEDYNGGTEVGQNVSLATLTEEEQSRERKALEDQLPPATPRAASKSLTAPTDTIIARHVRNVQVPESMAKEYRNKSGIASPNTRSGFAVSTLGRNGKNLTLKEQSSTIERLSKENFDLKLKVMFLSDRLDKLSEEGVKEMISENVELKTGLAVIQRDNKALKRKVKELEKQLKDDEARPSTADTSNSDASPKWFDQEGAQEREEELLYLRERVEEYVTEIEKLRSESIQRESEKRNLAEHVRSMGERRGQSVEAREEMDVWKDLLEQETARREQGDEENRKLREEIYRLKSEAPSTSGVPGLSHTTNIYNITKKRQVSPSRPRSDLSDRLDDRNGTFSSASTLADELRKESEQLRHENAELRREVGAQTSMLTSRNREKERLYQEIEDLKLGQRRGGGSVAGESIFERSASRAHERPVSRASAGTRQTNLTDTEREDFENKNSQLRDRLNSLKIRNQDLSRELESCMEDFETAVTHKKEAEALVTELQEALEVAENDLLTMQADRDEALQGQEEAEIMFESLRKEAQEELDGFAAEAQENEAEIERLQTDLADTTENFNALQNEMREMSEGVVRLEDDQENNMRRIQDLEKDLEEANHELEQMEQRLVEANEKLNRFSVQQESSQAEIAFLREEQDADKMKIGDFEAAARIAKQTLLGEKERTKELEDRLEKERDQREVLTSKSSKSEQKAQQVVNKLNRDYSTAKEEAHNLRDKLKAKDGEVKTSQNRLTALEDNLLAAMGNLNGTRDGLLGVRSVNSGLSTSLMIVQDVKRLSKELNQAFENRDKTAAAHLDSNSKKDRVLKQKDAELESHALKLRQLADLLDKETSAHRNMKNQYEMYQKNQQHTIRTIETKAARINELEIYKKQHSNKITSVENSYKDQLNERNNLLLALWKRLSVLCGKDWADSNRLIDNRALPSVETVASMLPAFSKLLFAAVKNIETLFGDFKSSIRNVEKTLWKEYKTLEDNLEVRTKRLDRLETLSRSALPGFTGDGRSEIARLKEANKALKTEVGSLRAVNDVQSNMYNDNHSPAPSVPTGPRHKVIDKTRTSTMTRTTSAVETFQRRSPTRSGSRVGSSDRDNTQTSNFEGPSEVDKSDKEAVLLLRLMEMESKLKVEREGRRIDRSGASERIMEARAENETLKAKIRRLEKKEERAGWRGGDGTVR